MQKESLTYKNYLLLKETYHFFPLSTSLCFGARKHVTCNTNPQMLHFKEGNDVPVVQYYCGIPET